MRQEMLSCMMSPYVELYLEKDDRQISEIECARKVLGKGMSLDMIACGDRQNCSNIGSRYSKNAFFGLSLSSPALLQQRLPGQPLADTQIRMPVTSG